MIKVILKLDDFYGIFPNKILRNLHKFLLKENVKVNWGIIGNKLENFSKKQIKETKEALSTGLYSFFNHGYFHNMNEFSLLNEEEQYQHLIKTQDIIKDKLGFDCVTFAAPCNALNDESLSALNRTSAIKYWLYGKDEFRGINIKRTLNIEVPLFRPNYKNFKEAFKNYHNEPLCLQCHPNQWKLLDFWRFKQIIRFLKKNDCEFIKIEDFKG